MDAAVVAAAVDVGVDGGLRTGSAGPGRAAPAVAGGVDQHADGGREARRDQLVAEALGEGLLVGVAVPVDPLRLADGLAGHVVVDGEVVLLQGAVVRRVGDEAVDVVDGRALGGRRLLEQGRGGTEVVVPADPAVVPGVDVVVDVRHVAELVQRVADALDVVAVGLHHVALRGGRRAAAGVGDEVRQRVDLDGGDDPQRGVLRVGEDRLDRVDVLRLVPVDLRRAELAVGGEGGAVTAGQVVDDELDDEFAGALLAQRLVEVGAQTHTAVGPVDRGDPVQPDARRLAGDAAAARLGGGLRGPLRVHVHLGAGIGVVDPVGRAAGTRRVGRPRVAAVVDVAGDAVEGERARDRVAAAVAALEAEADRSAGRELGVVALVGRGDGGTALAQLGVPAAGDLLIAGVGPLQRPRRLGGAVVGDGHGGGEAGAPLVLDLVVDGARDGGDVGAARVDGERRAGRAGDQGHGGQ
ncbi:hypothetical protein SPURM210S_04053 [Streptomyces purpurascens]